MRALLGTLFAALLLSAGLAGPAAAPAEADGLPLPLPTSPEGDVAGVNDWHCHPTAAHPRPVVLVHGTFGDRKHLLENLAQALLSEGYCVFSLDYGNRGTRDIPTSARTLKGFVDKILSATGARKVSMVGHSQGGMMPRYYVRFLGGVDKVDDLVGLVPSNHGTSQTGPGNPLTQAAFGAACPACVQQTAGSAFLTELNAGDETPGRVSYTQVTTRYDEVVVPYTSAYLAPGPRTTNITVQDLCPDDAHEHVFIPTDPVAIALVLNALGRRGPADPAFRPAC